MKHQMKYALDFKAIRCLKCKTVDFVLVTPEEWKNNNPCVTSAIIPGPLGLFPEEIYRGSDCIIFKCPACQANIRVSFQKVGPVKKQGKAVDPKKNLKKRRVK